MRRVNVYRVIADRALLLLLRIIADRCARLWNTAQYICRQRFLAGEKVPSYARLCSLLKEHEAYRALPSDIAQEVLKMVRESWNSFFKNRKNYRAGKIPEPPGLPGYCKDRRTGHRLIRCIPIKCTRSYSIHGSEFSMTAPSDLSSDRLRMRVRGCTRWNGKPGRAELLWDAARNVWYLHQSVKVNAPTRRPRRRRWAAVDRGARIPLALAIEGVPEVLVFRARELWKDFLYWSRQIAGLQSRLRTRGMHASRELRRMYARRRERLLAAYRGLARTVVDILKRHGVTDLIVGDLTGIRENMDFGPLNELVHNFWSFAELLRILKDACERAGIRVHEKPEGGTSSHCVLCGEDAARPIRSRVLCRNGHELHADINGALNLLYREPEVRARVEGRPGWRTLRWNGHRWVPIESACRVPSPAATSRLPPGG